MNILTLSSLYPNAIQPQHGLFVERRLRRLVEYSGATATVVAPVPWFPFRSRLFGSYAAFASVPDTDRRHGIDVHYPRFPLIPKVGMRFAPASMARGAAGRVRRILRDKGPVDIIDAHYFYPDGVAAARLAERLSLPFIVTARGSDINRIAKLPGPRRMIRDAAEKASAVVAVSAALGRSLAEMGVDSEKVHVLRNGVDLSFFSPGDRNASRRDLGIDAPTILSVGNLIEAKGHHIAIESLRHLQDARLIVIGAGGYEHSLRQLVSTLGLDARVSFTGSLPPESLREYYRAADVLFLLSQREGMPNVVLEAIACGTPVVASDVGGVAEVLSSPVAGELVSERGAAEAAAAWRALKDRGIDRSQVRAHAEQFSWDHTIERLHALIRRCIDGAHS